ncbi:hypothetical protein CGJ20_16650 [Vibrio parahaemolyticus]|nr:hypothetical protein CGJ20_16650 [Vibrio parahaemolyticus]
MQLCLAAFSPCKKIETPNDRLHSGFKKSNGLHLGFEVGLGRKKVPNLALSQYWQGLPALDFNRDAKQ